MVGAGDPVCSQGVGFAEGGHRVRRDGARLGGEGLPAPDTLVERHLSPISPMSPCSKNLPVKGPCLGDR